jgi:flagellar hook-basal body complex protein FliE
MAKHAGIYIRDLLKALRKQDDNAVIREVHFLASQFTTMEKMLKDKKWNAKYSESVNEAGMGILTTDQSDVLQGIVLRNKNKNLKAILKIVLKDPMFKGVDKKELLGYIDGARQFVKYMKSHPMESVKEDRDYKAEYKKYGSSTKAKKYRAELNQYNRKKGTYGNGDGKDASHKGGKIVGFEKESTNRGRREKSRLKKENIRKSINEAVEPQGNMAKIAKIVKRKQASKLGGVMIDMQSASLLMKLWDAVSDKDKEKMNTLNPKVLTTVIKKLWSRVNLKLPM